MRVLVFADAEPDYDIAVLYDSDSKFALSTQGPLRAPGALVDPDSYRRIVGAFSRGIFDAKRNSDSCARSSCFPHAVVTFPGGCGPSFPLLVVAGFYTAGDDDLAFLVSYAHEAGTGAGPGPGTPTGRAASASSGNCRPERGGRRLVRRDDEPLGPVAVVSDLLAGSAAEFAELLIPDGADVLARFQHPHLSRWAAVTTSGGTGPDHRGRRPPGPDAGAIPCRLARSPGCWRLDPPGVHHRGHGQTTGSRLHVLHNWSWDAATAAAPALLRDVLTNETITSGSPQLGPRTFACLPKRSLVGERHRCQRTRPTSQGRSTRCPSRKVQLLTGRDFWTTWPIEKIGLRRMLVSDGPSGCAARPGTSATRR